MKKICKPLYLLSLSVLILFLILLNPHQTLAATSAITPASGAHTTGNEFTVGLNASSSNVQITTAEIRILVPRAVFNEPTNITAHLPTNFDGTTSLLTNDTTNWQILFTGNVKSGTASIALSSSPFITFSVSAKTGATTGTIEVAANDSYLVAYEGGTVVTPFTHTSASYTFTDSAGPTNTPQPTNTPNPTATPDPTVPTATPDPNAPTPTPTLPPGFEPFETACDGNIDLNSDDKADIADLIKLTGNYGKTHATGADGDLNCDGTVNHIDFLHWLRRRLLWQFVDWGG